jgi:YidC/Oxa1 family membrane protein insertase
VIYICTQLGSSTVSAMAMTDKNQKRLMFALPFIFVPFIISFPAGLMVYWITTNAWTIGQQLLIRKVLPPPHLHDAKGDEVDEEEPEAGEKKGLRGMLDEIREAAGFEKEEEPAGNGKGQRGRERAAAKAGGKSGTRSGGGAKAGGSTGSGKRASGTKAGAGAKGDGSSSGGGKGGKKTASGGNGRAKAPPPSPRKKKKRSGRRR